MSKTAHSQVFYARHYREVAKLLATSTEPDNTIQAMTELFGQHFQNDNPQFDWKRWQSYLTRCREGAKK